MRADYGFHPLPQGSAIKPRLELGPSIRDIASVYESSNTPRAVAQLQCNLVTRKLHAPTLESDHRGPPVWYEICMNLASVRGAVLAESQQSLAVIRGLSLD